MLIVDTGPLYAAADRRDRHHRACVDLLVGAERPLVVPALVVGELGCLLADRLGPEAEQALARSIESGELQVESVLDSEWRRISELADQQLGIVDASLVALAERLRVDTLATLDHRHFGPVRPAHVAAFRLLP